MLRLNINFHALYYNKFYLFILLSFFLYLSLSESDSFFMRAGSVDAIKSGQTKMRIGGFGGNEGQRVFRSNKNIKILKLTEILELLDY